MSREIPLEITHLRNRLRQDFTDRLPVATFGSGEEKERNFLSHALAAMAIQRLSGCSADEAAAAVVDGGGDSGIDGIQYSPTVRRLWVVQSKFFAEGYCSVRCKSTFSTFRRSIQKCVVEERRVSSASLSTSERATSIISQTSRISCSSWMSRIVTALRRAYAPSTS